MTMADPIEWAKVAENIVKTRAWLYNLSQKENMDYQIDTKIVQIRYLLLIALEEIDKLAQLDGEGWL